MPFFLIFLASIVGSPHCAAMCGGFVAISGQSARPVCSQTVYHLGRLCTYLLLGALAGSFGSALNQVGPTIGLTRAAAILTGTLLLISGLTMLSGQSAKLHRIFPLNRIFALHQKFLAPRTRRPYFPFALGLFSTLLPCGWLYSYVVVAAGTGSPLWAMVAMFCFWAGTLPLLLSIGTLSNLITSPLKKFTPTLVSLLMIAAGIVSLTGHLDSSPVEHGGAHHHCATPSHHPEQKLP